MFRSCDPDPQLFLTYMALDRPKLLLMIRARMAWISETVQSVEDGCHTCGQGSVVVADTQDR